MKTKNNDIKSPGILVCQYSYRHDKDHGAQNSDLYDNAIYKLL